MAYTCGRCRKAEGIGEYYSNGEEKKKCTEYRSKLYKKIVSSKQERCNYFGYKRGEWHVTTAIIDLLGLDYTTLEVVKTLREVLRTYPEGKRILAKYDLIGPIIADRLIQNNAVELADKLYTYYIGPCRVLIEEGNEKKAINLYVEMLTGLVNNLNINDTVLEDYYNNYDNIFDEKGQVKSLS